MLCNFLYVARHYHLSDYIDKFNQLSLRITPHLVPILCPSHKDVRPALRDGRLK